MMTKQYFKDLIAATPTRVWVNNPTAVEVRLALEQGAVGCTTNPAFAGGLIRRVPEYVLPVISKVVAAEPDDARASELIQQHLLAPILEAFLPTYERSGGSEGYVSIQGSPDRDADAAAIRAQAHTARSLAPNCVPKIPATGPGLEAFDELVSEGHPTIVTEVFSLAQVVETCERYARATASGTRPPFIIAPITGIFGDHLRAVAERDGIEVEPALLDLSGVAFARAAARLVREREYPVTLLFGGARSMVDLTELVGERHQATINWSTFEDILAADVSVRLTIRNDLPDGVVRTLTSSFDAMRRALSEDGLAIEEFEGFGPVQHFRDNFVAGWRTLQHAIIESRAHLGAPV